MKTCNSCGHEIEKPELSPRLIQVLDNTFERKIPSNTMELRQALHIMTACCAALGGEQWSHELLVDWLTMRELQNPGFLDTLHNLGKTN